jgi:hypothetical protein
VEIAGRTIQFENSQYTCSEKEVLDSLLKSQDFGRIFFWLDDAPAVLQGIASANERAERTHKGMLKKEIEGLLPGHSIPTTFEATPYNMEVPAEDGGR